MRKLPQAFEYKMRELLGSEFKDYLACFDEPRYYGLRVNTKKISVKRFREICPFDISPVPWIENGFYYDGETLSPAKHPYYFAGLYYLQEPSAMTPANRLPVSPGDRVLDLCAAPGGKATELGARLLGRGVLAANDVSSSRAKGLLKNIEVFGVGNVLVSSEEPARLAPRFQGYFDKILIDAPCSGEGMFRKDQKMARSWEEHGPEYFSNIQKSIITVAQSMLKTGGLLLYSTCTFDRRENEDVILHLLRECPEFRTVDIAPYEGFAEGISGGSDGLSRTVRIYPHKMRGEGHYLALLQKGERPDAGEDMEVSSEASSEESSERKRPDQKLPEDLEAFLGALGWKDFAGPIEIHNGKVYAMPGGLRHMRGIRFLRTGLFLGELKKNRFEPSQALAMTLKQEDYPYVINFSYSDYKDPRVIKYLKGETVEIGAKDQTGHKEKGWYLVCVDNYPLGWGKLSCGILKNKYLPGWRMQ